MSLSLVMTVYLGFKQKINPNFPYYEPGVIILSLGK